MLLPTSLTLAPSSRTLLNCPYAFRQTVRDLGGEWCKELKSWYVPREVKLRPFVGWLHPREFYGGGSGEVREPSVFRVDRAEVLECGFDEKESAKLAGASWHPSTKTWTAPANTDLLRFLPWLPPSSLPSPRGEDRLPYLAREAGELVRDAEGRGEVTGKKAAVLAAKLEKALAIGGVGGGEGGALLTLVMVSSASARRAEAAVFGVLKAVAEARHGPPPAKARARALEALSVRLEGVCDESGEVLRPGENWYHRRPIKHLTPRGVRLAVGRDISEEVYLAKGELFRGLGDFSKIEAPADLGTAASTYLLEHGKRGRCHYCGERLKAVGTAREKGADHDDWNGREYHKACWSEIGGGK